MPHVLDFAAELPFRDACARKDLRVFLGQCQHMPSTPTHTAYAKEDATYVAAAPHSGTGPGPLADPLPTPSRPNKRAVAPTPIVADHGFTPSETQRPQPMYDTIADAVHASSFAFAHAKDV